MDYKTAYDQFIEFKKKSHLTKEEEYQYIEILEYLIEQTKDPFFMVDLGGYYYERKEFPLALKYYEMADANGDKWAAEGLGYIYYYGRTGEVNYEKAFQYYSKASKNGNPNSTLKLADMYKNGYYVTRNYDKYVQIVEELYEAYKDKMQLGNPIAEIFSRLGAIRMKQNRKEEAIELFLEAKDFLKWLLNHVHFFGDITRMTWILKDLYQIHPIDYSDLDIYDLLYICKKPCFVHFYYEDKKYDLQAIEEENEVVIHFEGKWYHNITDFFNQATLNNEYITRLSSYIYNIEVIYDKTNQ